MNALVEKQALDPRSIQDLMTRVDASFPPGRGRLVGFIACTPGEGTSSVAMAYARSVATQYRRRVLLLDAGSQSDTPPVAGVGSLTGVLATLAQRQASEGNGSHASAALGMSASAASSGLWQLLPQTDLWYALRAAYDEVVIDLPAASQSRLGLAVAPYCDGVTMVLAAEQTRAPVADNLLMHLRTVRARVLGAVLNRRRYHLPQRVYRLL
jgi:protein-tyrosine kinase